MRKTLLFLLLVLGVNISFAQTAEYGKITEAKKFEEYISKNGDRLKVGDSLQIGIATAATHFVYVSQGEGANMHPTHSGKKVKITKIYSAGRKNSGYKIFINFKGFGLLPVFVDYETALEVGEIINPNGSLTREQAIYKLKESKELLDLEVITQDEYNKLKEELTPIITR